MLVLTRRPGESIVIGNEVVVTVLEVRGDQIRVGVDAPRSIQVHREEVYREVQRENERAASSAARAGSLVRRASPSQAPSRGPGSASAQRLSTRDPGGDDDTATPSDE